MPNKKYISINGDADGLQERSLKADVGEFAYVDRGKIADTYDVDILVAPFDTAALKIGSHRFKAASWAGVTNPPAKLSPNGHFAVLVADGITKTITYIADTTETDGCLVTRAAELVVIDAVVETWNYFVSVTETENNGAIAVPSGYDKGRALDTSRKAAPAAYVQQYASLNRGTRSGQINFNSSLSPGNTHVTFDTTSIAAPPTNQNTGTLRNDVAGCVVFQYWYPDNSPSLYFRERSAAKIWSSWEQATEGNLVADGKVYVASYAKRGIGIGRQLVPVYSAAQADQRFRVIGGYGINVVDTPSGAIVSWSGSSSAIGADAPLNYNPSTNRISLDSAKISQWDTAYNYGPHVGLYAPLERALTVSGTTGRVTVAGGTQSLAANRSWSVDLSAIHAGLSAGSSTQVAAPVVDAYGRVTSMSSVAIAFPVTSVNGKTGAVALSTTDVPEGTNLYWTTSRGDALYVRLSGAYANPTFITSLDYSKITNVPDYGGMYVPIVRTLSFLGAAGQIAITGGSQSLVSNRTWTVGLETVHTGLSAGSSTQVAAPVVDAYGRVTSMSSVAIAFPVTSVNGKTGAVALSTTDVPEGTNLYWTPSRGDARYVQLSGAYANPTFITSLDYSKITNTPDFAGLYVPIVRNLTVSGTAGRVAVAGGTQSLASSRTWTVDLATVHTGLSGGSTITTPALTVDAYGRVTAMTYSTILFPVTSVNGQTGAVALNTDNIAEGVTNLYWTTARGDARYSQLGHTHTWAQISGVPAFLLQAYTTIQADTLPVSQRSNLNFSPEFSISDSSANNRTTVGIAAVPYAKVTGVPAFLLTETDPTVPSYVKAITESNIADWSSKVGGSGTVNYVAKFTSGGVVGNSSIYDNGNVGIGTNDPGSYKLRVNGAIYADGDAAGVALWMVSGRAIRATGTLNIDAGASSPIYFRSGGGASYLMELNANGKLRFNTYYSATAWTGTPVALLATDNGGNVLTLSTLLYADRIHGHVIGDTTGLQAALDAKATIGHGHTIPDVSGLQAALDGKTPWGHGHIIGDVSGLQPALDNRPTWDAIYTRTQLNTSGGGGQVHWNNLIGVPGLAYAGHGHTIPDVSGLQAALDGKTPWGHGHIIGDVSGLQPALDNRPTWGDIYTRSQSDSRYLQSESDPFGYSAHWFSIAGRNLTLGLQTRNLGQGYASVTLPVSYQYDIATQQLLNGSHLVRLNRDDGFYVDRTITETDPKGVSSTFGSYGSGNLSITIVLRDGTQITCNIPFSGGS
ncbi:hypothetical protein DTQ70_04285 [Runella sp. SP2]|nr:hypothetical protein DTQ70_04285 [Runella sp. SP2]